MVVPKGTSFRFTKLNYETPSNFLVVADFGAL